MRVSFYPAEKTCIIFYAFVEFFAPLALFPFTTSAQFYPLCFVRIFGILKKKEFPSHLYRTHQFSIVGPMVC